MWYCGFLRWCKKMQEGCSWASMHRLAHEQRLWAKTPLLTKLETSSSETFRLGFVLCSQEPSCSQDPLLSISDHSYFFHCNKTNIYSVLPDRPFLQWWRCFIAVIILDIGSYSSHPSNVDWICVSPRTHMLKLNPQGNGIRRQGLWEAIRSWWQGLHVWDQCPYKRDPRALFTPLTMWS